MFVKLAARVGFVVPVIIVVLGQVPAFDFAILACGALLSRRTFGYLSPQIKKKKVRRVDFEKFLFFRWDTSRKGDGGERFECFCT